MSAIPPNVIGSMLGTSFAQNQASQIRSSEDAAKVSAERRQLSAVSELDSVVETADNDTQIYADAEGSGSQGRAFSESEPESETQAETLRVPDPDEDGHIDFEA